MLKRNFLKEKLETGKHVLGTWSIIPSTVTTDIIASTGLDFIIIDQEHGPISFETAQNMAMVCESRGVSPVMRIGNIDEADILKAMDIGVHCIQIPNVESNEDVIKLIQLAKYPPAGKRGFSPFTRAGNYSIDSATILTQRANENTLIAVNIEGKEAIDTFDDILAIEGVDIFFIGRFDLSKALGIPGQVNDIRVTQSLRELTNKINTAGKYSGTIATSEAEMEQYIKMGLKYIVYLVDCEILRSGYKTITENFRRVVDE